ncbi:MAG: thermonuclease family protein [Thermoguttaceae bacterium]
MDRRFRRRRTRPPVFVLLLLALVAVRLLMTQRDDPPPEALHEGDYQVERVVDGDTLLLDNGARVRLQGIDTPETVMPDHPIEPWGPEAAAFTRDFVAGGTVRLQLGLDRKDDYGRFLAFVWVEESLLNEELVRVGLATAEQGFFYNPAMKRRLVAAEKEAQAARRGIWSTDEGSTSE